MELFIGFILGVVLLGFGVLIFKNRLFQAGEAQSEAAALLVEKQLREMVPGILKESNEMLVSMANEKLGAEKKEIKSDMENKRGEIERMVKTIQEDLKFNQKELIEAEKKRVGSFHALREKLEEQQKVTEDLRVTTENLRNVLSNNQLRGQFGEKVADDLLKMAGFVRGLDYEFNKKMQSTETRPDFSVFLPDGTMINIDAKFPYANLQKYTETDDKEQKLKFLRDFERDVKEKIKQVTTRDYINVEENTVDFVILFIPNEMIFSFIYEKLQDVWQDAMAKKVILAGPFSFTAILRMVRQAYENFRYQSNIRQIIDHVREFEKEFSKYNEKFELIGKRIESLDKAYVEVNSTRTNKLLKTMDKVRLEGVDEQFNSPVKPVLIPDSE